MNLSSPVKVSLMCFTIGAIAFSLSFASSWILSARLYSGRTMMLTTRLRITIERIVLPDILEMMEKIISRRYSMG